MRKIYVKKIRNVEEGATPKIERGLKIFNKDIEVYDEETGVLLAIFLKKVIPKDMIEIGREMVKYKGKSNARGAYAGVKKTDEKKVVMSGKHKGMKDMKQKSATSIMLGYLIPYLVKNPKPQLSSRTKVDLGFYNEKVKKLFCFYDNIIKKINPEEFKIQKDNLKNIPKEVKISDITTNIQLNYNQTAHYHEDKGNKNLYGSLTTFNPTEDKFKGSEFVLGNYKIGFNLKEGDFLFCNQSKIHGTLPRVSGDRLSLVGFQSGRLINYFNRGNKEIKKVGNQKGKGEEGVVYVIPTYDRKNELIKKSLSFLNKYKINKKNIYVFVANKEQKEFYKEVENMGYKVIIAQKGLTNARNFIINYFPTGQKIVSLDDDVRGLKECKEGKMVDIKSLKMVVNEGFKLLKKHKLQLFGFYPIVNDLFQCKKDKISLDLTFIAGPIYGFINDKSLRLGNETRMKEDYARTLKSYVKYGGVVRFNKIGILTTYGSKGGLSEMRESGLREKESAYHLKKQYPDLVHFLNRKRVKEGLRFDIFLKDKRK